MLVALFFFQEIFNPKLKLQSLCIDIKNIKQNIIIAVDQEGGRVQRFKGEFTALAFNARLGDYLLKKNKL